MTVDEFDVQFDIFYNNIASNAAPSVDSYEKSVFLTQAQRDIVIELYSGRAIPGVSFESTEEARRYLKELTKIVELTDTTEDKVNNTYTYKLPEDVWFITMEEATYHCDECNCINGYSPSVVPTRQDNLQRDLKNPFRGPSKERVLRVDVDNNQLRLYSKYSIGSYKIWYIKQPIPIILKNVDSTLHLDNKSIADHLKNDDDTSKDGQSSELNPILHRAILERAVVLAKIAYIGKE